MKKCPKCGQNNIDDSKYCGKCGSELNTVIICPFCNAQNNTENTTCINCSKPLNTNVIPQTNQENNKFQQYNALPSNKLDLKALLIGSFSISIISILLFVIIYFLYYYYIITYDGSLVLLILSIIMAGTIGMIIFNKINSEENRAKNIIFISALSTIIILIISSLTGGSGFNYGYILIFAFIIIGAYIGDYIEKNGKI